MKSEHQSQCLEAMDIVLRNMAKPTLNFIKVAYATLEKEKRKEEEEKEEKTWLLFHLYSCKRYSTTHTCQREDMWNTNATQMHQGTILKKSLLLQKK